MIIVKERFPCGYEVFIKVSWLDVFGFKYDGTESYPIHGKECKRK